MATLLGRHLGLAVDADDLRARGEELERAWWRIVDDAQEPPHRRDAMYT